MRRAGFGFLLFAFFATCSQFFFLAADKFGLVAGFFLAADQLCIVNHRRTGRSFHHRGFTALGHGVHAVFAANEGALFTHFHLDGAGFATGISLFDLGGLLFHQGDFLAVATGGAVAALQIVEQAVLVGVRQNVAGRLLDNPCGLQLVQQGFGRFFEFTGKLSDGRT